MDYEWDESLSPALLEACTSGEAATVSDLLRRKANPNCRDDQGMAPLLWAARKGRTEVARILLDHDPPADINASRDQNGWTADAPATGTTAHKSLWTLSWEAPRGPCISVVRPG